jgi:uncharacterized SAM-binding protein YcdF (DUF218 family)
MNIKRKKAGIVLQGFLMSIIINSCSFSSKTTKKLFNQSLKTSYDVIIVPGYPFENFVWDRNMKGRVYWSKYLYDIGVSKNIMYSGSSVASPYYEGIIMALYAEAIGIPAKNIFTETKAEHSTENIYYSYKKAKQLGFKKIAVASDPFQTKLLRRYIRKKVSPDVPVIPFVADTLRMLQPTMTDPPIDYKQAFNKDYKSLKEREGFWQRFRGTRGLNVDTTLYR